jgi:hypothetical protein
MPDVNIPRGGGWQATIAHRDKMGAAYVVCERRGPAAYWQAPGASTVYVVFPAPAGG